MKSRESNQRLKNVVPLSLLFDHQSTPRAPPPRPRPPPFPSRSSPLWTFFCFFDHIRSLQEVRIACSQKELKNENGPGGKKGCGGLLVTFLFLSTLSLAPPFSLAFSPRGRQKRAKSPPPPRPFRRRGLVPRPREAISTGCLTSSSAREVIWRPSRPIEAVLRPRRGDRSGSVGVGVGREEGDDGSRKSRSPISVVSCPKTSIPFIIDARGS